MTDGQHELRTRLTRLAQHAAPLGGTGTAERAVAVAARRRQRTGRWAAGALAVVLLVTGAALTRPDPVVAAAQPGSTATARPTTTPPDLYLQPPRGSLAGDPAFLAAVAALPWTGLDPENGLSRRIDADSRRVVYAADVPGGHRWAVVLASYGAQWVLNWFTGPRGAEPGQLSEAYGPTVFYPSAQPIALMDVSGTTGPVLVLGEPGGTAEYSPSLDRAPDGTLGRTFTPLPVVDGVPLGLVTLPVTWGAGELYEVRDGERSQIDDWLTTGNPPWARTDLDVGAPDGEVLAACLTAQGFTVQAAPPSAGVYFDDPRAGDLSSAEQAVRDQQSDDCFAAATGG